MRVGGRMRQRVILAMDEREKERERERERERETMERVRKYVSKASSTMRSILG